MFWVLIFAIILIGSYGTALPEDLSDPIDNIQSSSGASVHNALESLDSGGSNRQPLNSDTNSESLLADCSSGTGTGSKNLKREAACWVAPANKTPPRKLYIPEWMRKWLEKFPSRDRKERNICENHGLHTILVTCSGPEVDPIEAIWIDMVINCVAGWLPSFTDVALSSMLKTTQEFRITRQLGKKSTFMT